MSGIWVAEVSVDVVDPGSSGRAETDAIVEGPKWAGRTITFSFPTLAGYADYGGVDEVASNFEQFSSVQQAAVRTILAQISGFTGLTFVELTGGDAGNATLRFAMSDLPDTAYAYLPTGSAVGGDAWFNNSSGNFDNPVVGSYAWLGLMHEIGHALGLGHPHESTPPLDLERDWMAYTVMTYRSYRGAAPDGYRNSESSYAQTYMIEDMAALQFLYGANYSARSGNTTYRWLETTGELFIDGVSQGVPADRKIFMTVWDGGGTDTFDLSDYSTSLNIDLRPGAFSLFDGGQSPSLGGPGNDVNVIAPLLVDGDTRGLIENVIGSSLGSDTIYGNQADNHIVVNRGSNTVWGLEGNDWIEGGNGSDNLFGGPGNDHINGGSFGDHLHGEDGDDFIEGGGGYFDVLEGGEGNDHLVGGADYDRLFGGEGDDKLFGEGWGDHLDGGPGADYMAGGPGDDDYYMDNPGDVIFELPGEGTDRVWTSLSLVLFPNLEGAFLYGTDDLKLTGNELDNTLHGNSGANILSGMDGNDTIMGGEGADTILGGEGNDTIIFEAADGGVFVNLTLGRGYVNESFGDTYDSIENVVGSRFDDFIIGDPGVNRLDGERGNDIIIGAVGADEIIGGDGLDWASYEDNSGTVFVNLTLRQGFNNAAHGDTYDGIENLIGGLMDDFFIGDEGANRLNGAMGADTLLGAGGADIFMFTYAPGATSTWGNPNVDLILDFTTGVDTIELSAGAFPGLAAGALPAAAFYAGTAAHDGDDRIVYDAASGKLWFDPDGTGAQAAMLFATLGETSHPAAIAASDFVVV